jgi:hypothetical protein
VRTGVFSRFKKRERKESPANEIGRLLGNLSLEQKCGRADSCAAAHGSAGHSSRHATKAHELRLEEIRAALNADFAEAMFAHERSDHLRLNEQRSAWEQRNQRDALQ